MESATQAIRAYYRVASAHFDADAAALERSDAAFYLDIARRAGGPVLEFGCGTGRIGIEIVRAGPSYTGVEVSTAMLERFEEKLEAEPEEVRKRARVKDGDARSTHLERRFACVLAPFDLLAHLLDDDDRRRALNRCRAHLAPSGVLALDVSVPTYPRLGELVEAGESKPQVELERDGGGKSKIRRTATIQADAANQQLRYHREWLEVGPRGGTKSIAEADL
ncbi:MAG TPA: class I SAM-dependent methyltransferase, partial [Planctomycetota bacterium]|nr:class I SAM-dependent methyltransferase [Planctomycetota bacterium]